MATKHTDSCLQKAADDEPIFVLRAKDKHAPHVVRLWASLAKETGCPPTKTKEAHELADRMEAWAQQNGSKFPD